MMHNVERRRAAMRSKSSLPASIPGVTSLLCFGILLTLPAGCPVTPPADLPDDAKTMTLTRVAEGFGAPVDLAAPNDGTGRLFVVDQDGVIRVVFAGQVLDPPLLDLRARIDRPTLASDERGLLGLALHPSFAGNGRLFVYFNTPPTAEAPAQTATEVRLSEFRISAGQPNVADAGSERVLFRVAKPQVNHNGGQIAFGPDGYLYVGIGDGGGAGDTGFGHTVLIGNAQDTSNFFGSILRIDVDSGDPYGIPPTNPFVGSVTARPEIYAYGLRNPWRFSFDSGAGSTGQLLVGDVGQALVEEVNSVVLGGNYGWNIREGSLCFSSTTPTTPPGSCPTVGLNGSPLRAPILEYRHTDETGAPFGSSVVGGFVYRGAAVPNLVGKYVFGDYAAGTGANGKIFVAEQQTEGAWTFEEVRIAGTEDGRIGRYVLAFGRDTAGELYVLTRGSAGPRGTSGAVDRIVGYE